MSKKQNLLLLFDRPTEPMILPKGSEGVNFKVPNQYLKDEYQDLGPQLVTTFANRIGGDDNDVTVKDISLPSLGEITDLGRDENFSLFIPKHRRLAGKLINIFMGMKDPDDLMAVAVYARERVNPVLFNYAFSVALMHRRDTRDLELPSVLFSFPDRYMDSKVFSRMREVANVVPEPQRTPVFIPRDYTASDLEDEHRLAYFREDIGINLHHWHWHLVYPFEGPMEVVNKNRRGELFYYMHQQIVARYNFERLSNGMKRVERFTNFNDPMPEGYFPKLDSLVANRSYPARVPNMRWSNLRREVDQIYVDIDEMKRWRDRIFDAIHSGFARDENRRQVELTENEGIDILGNMVESSILSPDRDYYGDLHNMGHTMASYVHDPDHRHLESFAVIGDSSTAMRDPFFYRWHAYMDDIFQNLKDRLPRYTVDQLNFANVTVQDVQVQTQGAPVNTLQTYWQQSDLDLSRGLDFQPRGAVLVRFTHLQHRPFTYKVTVNNDTNRPTVGTCRIFMAPRFDERRNPWLFRTQKNMFIELDKFRVNLKPGSNSISRDSSLSSVTIPFERTYRNLDSRRPVGGDALARFNLCGCGWPENMLIPKGNDRFEAELFVMISDYANDRIDQDVVGQPGDAGSFCGIKDKLYPDRRSMGYPFDRQPRAGVDTLQQFLTPNMRVRNVIIQFNNRVLTPGEKF
uniref:Phenoloxidase 1-like n=1 Tax=Diabrotica virgifera virgifera TaxID=50390 RepID=A0A6P7FUF2_DIAVI